MNFKEQMYELAFGDGAIDKDYSEEEVIERLKEFTELSHRFENLRQSDILYDKNSFIALVCSAEDIAGHIKKDRDSDEPTKEELEIAQIMVDSDYFRSKFTDIIMNDFWETIDCIYEDSDMMKTIRGENQN